MKQRFFVTAALAVAAFGAQAGVLTGFDGSAEGWSGLTADLGSSGAPVQAAATLGFSAAGGNPGGRISVLDPDGNDTFFAAPAAFLGNQSSALGTTLGYDLFTDETPDYAGPNVVLKGNNGVTLIHRQNTQPAVQNQWVSFSVALAQDGFWVADSAGGSLATAADFQGVLADLAALWISGENHNGTTETSSLDNVRLGRVGQPLPEPATLLLVASAAAALSLRRRKS